MSVLNKSQSKNTLSENDRNLIYVFFILQIYFSGNIFSFAFWNSSFAFGYILGFYGIWALGLSVLLLFFLFLQKRFRKNQIRLNIAFASFLSIPFGFILWLQSFEFYSTGRSWYQVPLLLVLIYMYFRFATLNIRKTTILVSALLGASFMGHAKITKKYVNKTLDIENVALSKKNNIHVIMIDSLTHSEFTKTYMGINNPAADYLASLNNVIYAGNMGFSERVPTKPAWATLS